MLSKRGINIPTVEIREIKADALDQYAEIPIAFEVKSIFRVELIDGGLGGIRLREEKVVPPYVKDYDACEDGGPERWLRHFDIRNWRIFLAMDGDRRVGGTTVAFNTPGVRMLDGRSDLTALWDIRVRPDFRGCGIGTKLFSHAVGWSRKRGCRQMKVETQNVNVPACRFYAKQGCQLGKIDLYGYAGHPEVGHEVMLIWYLDL